MALNESDRLSLLALIVAIVALIVSAWQLAQQLFATAADGKRFCQASVMGVWARKTRLSWRWSQIRFETKYTTPEIRFTSGISEGHRESQAAQQRRLWYRIPVVKWLVEVSLGPSSDWDGYFEITTNRAEAPLELRKTRQPALGVSARSAAERWSLWFLSWWDGSYKSDSPDVVSWPKLLERLYVNQNRSLRKVGAQQNAAALNGVSGKELEKGTVDDHHDPPSADITPTERQQGEDRVVVRLVERSWDLVPPDVVRPLAQSTVGSMITIAHRLGMTWQGDFGPNEGQMNASGCGHTLTSETVRGLGLVLQYTYHEESQKVRNAVGTRRGVTHKDYLVPTVLADKLHCGILAIDSKAVPTGLDIEDIHLIDAARKVDMPGLLHRLEISGSEFDELRDNKHRNQYGAPHRKFKHAIEDAVSMLCSIPTLPSARARWITWPFRTIRQPFTPTRQKQGLEAVRDNLTTYVASHKPAARLMEDREHSVLKYLDASPLDYLNELLDTMAYLSAHRKSADPSEQQEMCRLYERLRTIHERTSGVFAHIQIPPTLIDDEEEPLPFLLVMVAAHIKLATKHGTTADERAMFNDEQDPDGNREIDNEHRGRFAKELAGLYVGDLENAGEKTVRKHVRRSGYTSLLEAGVIPALWWTLVVRSACWWLSVHIKKPETQIPSYWYNSQTPVFIT